MKNLKSTSLGVLFGAVLALLSLPALPQSSCTVTSPVNVCPQGDLDLFTTNQNSSTVTNPNILFVLDNTANWAGNDQKFPGMDQGQAEVLSIKNALASLGAAAANINVGIMEFPAGETGSSPHGGYIRYAVKQMNATNLSSMNTVLSTMSANWNDSKHERQNSNLAYGNLMYDAHNYFKGLAPVAVSADVSNTGNADSAGYVSNYTLFKAPTGGTCGHNYIIFIANPASSGPNSDSATNTAALAAVGGSTTQPLVDLFNGGNVYSNLGLSNSCYAQTAAGAASCSTTEPSGSFSSLCAPYASCACDSVIADGSTGLPACASGTQRYSVFGTNTGSASTTTTTTTTTAAGTSACYTGSSAAQSAADHGGLTCPANTDTGAASNPRVVTTYSCSYSYGSTGGGSCPNTAGTPGAPVAGAPSSSPAGTGASNACYVNASACTSAGDKDSLTCPATSATTPATCTSYPCTQSYTTHSCSYACGASSTACTASGSGSKSITACSSSKGGTSASVNANTDANSPACPGTAFVNTATRTYTCPGTATVGTPSCSGSGGNQHWPITRTVSYTDAATTKFTVTQTDTATPYTITTPGVANYTYPVTQTITKTVATTTTPAPTTSNLGNTFACYASLGSCSTSDYSSVASSYNGGLKCDVPATSGGSCPLSGIRYQVQGVNQGSVPSGAKGILEGKLPENANLWAQYMFQNNVATTYSIDVYNAKPSYQESELYASMAKLGGGRYFAAQNQSAIQGALINIFNEIQSVNSNFASAALPVSATNRAQNVNQVFIGMFRPDVAAAPRWYGNLKRYQLISGPTGTIDLGDATGGEAINSQTGFLSDCATSFWTSNSGSYWQTVTGDKPAPKGTCPTSANSPWSDAPDGPFVEKGATGEVVRQGNGGSAASVNRTVYSLTGTSTLPTAGSLANFNTTSAPTLGSSLIDFARGQDLNDENGNNVTTEPRSSIQGDVIHSRPLPVNYGATTTPIVVYYGSNDGTYRAVDAATGKEIWSFIAPEFNARLSRLMSNSPPVLLFNGITSTTPTPAPKDYFFDGSTGVYQAAGTGGKVWIYPTMHRGGRMLYAIDVTDPAAPAFKWRAGCPNLGDDIGCTVDSNGFGMSGIGQTWSLPNVAQIKGYTGSSGNPPVIIMGGGYDNCQDVNVASPDCSASKGRVVYVIDGDDGHVIRSFATTGSVAADVSLVDVNNDGLVDYAYSVDTSGNIWRLNFIDSTGVALTPANWTMDRVAYTSGAGRKFLFAPALLTAGTNTIYVAVGTGDREHPLIGEYPYPGAVTSGGVANRFYVYLDKISRTTPTNLDDATAMSDATGAICNSSQVLPTAEKTGWYLPLASGEQTVTSAVIAGGIVAFNTNTPTNPAAGACSSLGDAEGYLVDLYNGSGAIGVSGICGGKVRTPFVNGGLPPSPVIATVPVNGTVQTVIIGAAQKDGSASSTLQSQSLNQLIKSTRRGVFWKRSGDN